MSRIELGRIRRVLAGAHSSELSRARMAAVALVLSGNGVSTGDDGLSLLLLRRSERVGDPWSGHMALPGGHAHADDADLLHTARRETLEEVGIDLTDAELLGQLDDLTPMRSSDLLVRPFVFWTPTQRPTSLSDEVAETLWVPLDALASGALKSERDVDVRGSRLRVPAYVIEERVVWGMTFYLLDRFLGRLLAAP